MAIDTQAGSRTPRIGASGLFAVFTGLLGVSVSIYSSQRLSQLEDRRIQQEFTHAADGLRIAAQREIDLFIEVLESIRDLHNLSANISPEDFEEFVEKGMLHQKGVLGAFGFAQRFTHAQREMLEQDTNSNLRILEPDGAGHYRGAAQREQYSILTYETPENGLHVPVGYDFAYSPSESASLDRMFSTDQVVVGSRLPATASTNSYFLFAPIIYPFIETESGMLLPTTIPVGFAVAIFEPQMILARISSFAAFKDMDIEIRDGQGAVRAATGDPAPGPDDLSFRGPLPVADEVWSFLCVAHPDFGEAKRSGRATIVLVAGLLFTALLTGELLLMARRNRATEETVRRRTADLVDAKDKLEKEMHERLRLENEIIEISSREKERVGRDLHDSLGQKLTGAALLSRALVDHLPDDSKDRARKINEVIKESVTQVRRIARGLSPVDLGEEGLVDALRLLAEETEQTCGIACTFKTAGEPRIKPGPTSTHLYHIAQEAISNAVRHGKARHIAVALDAHGVLSVDDDGTGIPAHASQHGGMGLKLMRYRASMIGGSLDIEPRPEGGTRLVCRFSPPKTETTKGHE